MQPDQQLMDRFYQGTCSPAEAQQVMEWLLAQEEETDWSEAASKGAYPAEYEPAMLAFIQEEIQQEIRQPEVRVAVGQERGVRRLFWKVGAVAASVILIVGLGWLVLGRANWGRRGGGVEEAAHLTILHAPASVASTLQLADGSVVTLEPGAQLQYDRETYGKKDRILYLEGHAVFNVASVKDRPFSVVANGCTTTALGTSFSVATQPGGDVVVRLYTGKVVVRQAGVEKDVYLQPGEEMAYHRAVQQSLVSRFQEGSPRQGAVNRVAMSRKDIRYAGDTLVFNNAPLADVLDLLRRRYHVVIRYDRQSLSDAYFTGEVLPGDAIEIILNTVTRINNRTLVMTDDVFVIK